MTKTDAWRITQEGRRKKTSLEKYLPLTLLQGFERVVQGLHVRGCWRPNINFKFWPHCMTVTLCLSCSLRCSTRGLGVHSIGAFPRAPPGRVWPSLPHLVSSCLEFCWQLHWGFSECPLGRVWPSLPHLVPTVWKSAGNCPGTQTQLS